MAKLTLDERLKELEHLVWQLRVMVTQRQDTEAQATALKIKKLAQFIRSGCRARQRRDCLHPVTKPEIVGRYPEYDSGGTERVLRSVRCVTCGSQIGPINTTVERR